MFHLLVKYEAGCKRVARCLVIGFSSTPINRYPHNLKRMIELSKRLQQRIQTLLR